MSRKPQSIEKLDATARELCRLFQDGNRDDVLPLLKGLKKIEVAFVVAFAAERMAGSTRDELVTFFEDALFGATPVDVIAQRAAKIKTKPP